MTASETRRFEMLQRVHGFGDAHQDLFPPDSMGRQALNDLGAAVAQLNSYAVSKMAAAKEGRRAKSVARAALVNRLEVISRCARVIAEDVPGFDDSFHLPRPRNDQTLLTTGRVFVRDAEHAAAKFRTYGMPDGFVASLSRLVDNFEQAIRARQTGQDGHTAARTGIEHVLAAGTAAVRKLDVVVENQLQDDPITMAVWERDRRVDYALRQKRTGAKPASHVNPDTPAPAVPPTPDAPIPASSTGVAS